MIFYIHYILLTSGLSGTSVLLGVFLQTYSDATQSEIGFLLMTFPFVCLVVKPLFCSLADRYQAHKRYLVLSMILMLIGYSPYVLVPFFKSFYEAHLRFCWWLFFCAGQMGNCALGVAWSLGDSLAVNYAHRYGTSYSRMRLMGTVSWGVYGYIIGLIDELPFLPKYIPSFLTLYLSVILEIVIILLWNDDDFKMVEPEDPSTGLDLQPIEPAPQKLALEHQNTFVGLLNSPDKKSIELENYDNNNRKTKTTINSTDSDDKNKILHEEDANNNTQEDLNNNSSHNFEEKIDMISDTSLKPMMGQEHQQKSQEISLFLINNSLQDNINQVRDRSSSTENDAPASSKDGEDSLVKEEEERKPKNVNYQLILFKMIFKVDVRLIKYLIFFTLAGFVLAPMSFVFISVSQECQKQKDCNFARLAGYILICQASIETCCFLLVPSLKKLVGNLATLCIGLTSMSLRYLFYSFGYYDTGISVHWAIMGECLHGIMFGIYCTLMAEYALSFANQSKLFIPELRKQGLLMEPNEENKKEVEAEENEIKVALRATMQATFGGCMDGLGQGLGLLACGVLADAYGYVTLWKFFLTITASTLVGYFLIEISRSRWSDRSRKREVVEISNC